MWGAGAMVICELISCNNFLMISNNFKQPEKIINASGEDRCHGEIIKAGGKTL